MVSEDEGVNFGPEMVALAKSFKARFGDDDIPFIYTVPGPALAPNLVKPREIKGKSIVVEIDDWQKLDRVIEAAVN